MSQQGAFGTVFSLFGAKIRKKMRSYVLASNSRRVGRVSNRYPYRWPVLYFLSFAAALVYFSLLGLLWFLAWFRTRKVFYGLAFRCLSGFWRLCDWLVNKLTVSTLTLRKKE